LNLPTTLDDKYLYSIAEDFEGEDVESNVTISDKNAKGHLLGDGDIIAFDADDDEIDFLYLTYIIEEEDYYKEYYTFWYYVDRNVTVKGKVTDSYDGSEYEREYDLNLKKGWNVTYLEESYDHSSDIYKRKEIFASKKPSGINYAWHLFEEDDYDYRSAKVAKSVIEQKSFLKKLREAKGK